MQDGEPFRSESHWTSVHNWADPPSFPDEITFHDTTFRDGEQQPGVVFDEDEKVELGTRFSEAGIDRLEPGFPPVSDADKRAITRLADAGLDADVFALSRCVKADVELALECGVDGVILEIPSSKHLLEHAYDWSYEQAIEYAIEATEYAGEQGLHVSFFCVDASRADPEDFLSILNRVVDEGHADSVNVVDTFGGLSPEGTRAIVRVVAEAFDLPIEIHTHNDFGLGVANTLAALSAGAEIAHTTVMGLGERSGNANFEEVATALRALYGVDLDLDYGAFTDLAEATAAAAGVDMPVSKPIVGQNQFGMEAGLIVHWWNKLQKKDMPLTLFPYHWDLVGNDAPKVTVGKMSGLATVVYWCERLGLAVPDDSEQEEILASIKAVSIAEKRPLELDEFVSIYRRVLGLETT